MNFSMLCWGRRLGAWCHWSYLDAGKMEGVDSSQLSLHNLTLLATLLASSALRVSSSLWKDLRRPSVKRATLRGRNMTRLLTITTCLLRNAGTPSNTKPHKLEDLAGLKIYTHTFMVACEISQTPMVAPRPPPPTIPVQARKCGSAASAIRCYCILPFDKEIWQ